MPFDGSETEHDTRYRLLSRIGEQLGRVAELLATESSWCKGQLHSPQGGHCLLGALQVTASDRILEPILLQAIGEVTGRCYLRIEAFNDRRTTTHAHILAVLERARDNVRNGIPLGPPLDLSRAWTGACKRGKAFVTRLFGATADA